jgi:hypothetical protein
MRFTSAPFDALPIEAVVVDNSGFAAAVGLSGPYIFSYRVDQTLI